MRLLKRHGPLLVGVCLERSSSNDEYTPLFHVHNLLSPFPVISLGLPGGIPEAVCARLNQCIKVSKHDRDHMGAILNLGLRYPVLNEARLTWGAVGLLYADFLRQGRNLAIAREFTHGFADMVLLARWCGQLDYAARILEDAKRILSAGNLVPNAEAWKQGVDNLSVERAVLESTLAAEIAKHRLESIPDYPLEFSGDVELITDVYRAVWAAA